MINNKFKVGDVVRVNEKGNSTVCRAGDVGTVIAVGHGAVMIDFEKHFCVSCDALDLVEEDKNEYKFAIGDRVRVALGACMAKKGMVGTVIDTFTVDDISITRVRFDEPLTEDIYEWNLEETRLELIED